MKKNSIYELFPILPEEYLELETEFGKLCNYAAWQLLKKNAKNNHTDDFDDINQDLQAALIQAGSYYKRQVYIERCLETAKKYATGIVGQVLSELENLWRNRTRHGANRQKFGPFQEKLLEKVVKKTVPRGLRPKRKDRLVIDGRFPTYCKQIIWNKQKAMGKRITREKSIRSGLTSLSEFDYLSGLES